jgi:hypothetical protein
MFAPCLLGCRGTARQYPAAGGTADEALPHTRAGTSIARHQTVSADSCSSGLLICGFGARVPGGARIQNHSDLGFYSSGTVSWRSFPTYVCSTFARRARTWSSGTLPVPARPGQVHQGTTGGSSQVHRGRPHAGRRPGRRNDAPALQGQAPGARSWGRREVVHAPVQPFGTYIEPLMTSAMKFTIRFAARRSGSRSGL